MPEFAPMTAKKLYEKMLNWQKLRGKVAFDENTETVFWSIAGDLCLEITIGSSEATVNVFDSDKPEPLSLTHWHQDAEDIYEQMLAINERKIRIGYRNALLWKTIVLGGEPFKLEKRRFFRMRYLGENSNGNP